jgi:hypothetical protein
LCVFSACSGGPIYGGGAANNYPLRGGKMSNWEGGVRTIAVSTITRARLFVSPVFNFVVT